MSSDNLQPVLGISRRELLKRGGKVAAAAAISSVFSPFVFTGKAAPTKTFSFWQFYAPATQVGTQSKWFEDCVKGWNATHDVKVELQFVPVQDYLGHRPANARAAERRRRADTNRADTVRLKPPGPLHPALRGLHDNRPAGGVKTRSTLRWRTMVPLHKESRISLTVAH
jgi:hypothetical protein